MEKRSQPLAAVNESPLPPDRAFVVQLRPQGDAAELFVGRVEHLTSGVADRFASAEGLITFIRRVLASAAASPPGGAGQAERTARADREPDAHQESIAADVPRGDSQNMVRRLHP